VEGPMVFIHLYGAFWHNRADGGPGAVMAGGEVGGGVQMRMVTICLLYGCHGDLRHENGFNS
jgi:hypothetical protein